MAAEMSRVAAAFRSVGVARDAWRRGPPSRSAFAVRFVIAPSFLVRTTWVQGGDGSPRRYAPVPAELDCAGASRESSAVGRARVSRRPLRMRKEHGPAPAHPCRHGAVPLV